MNLVKRNLQLTVLRDPHWCAASHRCGSVEPRDTMQTLVGVTKICEVRKRGVPAIGIPNGDWSLPLPKVLGAKQSTFSPGPGRVATVSH
jgi:hypothetical protein